MVWTELHRHMLLQQGPRFHAPLESTYFLFVAYYREFHNRKSYHGFVLPVERELLKFSIWIINHAKELQKFVLFIKLFIVTKMEIPRNTLKGNTRHWIRPCNPKVLEVVSQHVLWSGSLWQPLSTSILKNKRFFSLLISKLLSAFSLWL